MPTAFASSSSTCQLRRVDEETGLELVKLLLQVAYADDVVTDAERDSLYATAARVAGAAGRDVVDEALVHRRPLPPPNMGLLARHRGDV
ncbi:MAG TPA: hypothetical protein VGF99_09560, partial [Myxococcota bacterium]